MKTLFFSLLLIAMFLLQFFHASNTPKQIHKKKFSDIDFTESFSAQQIFENELNAFQNDDKNEKDSRRNIQHQTTANTIPMRILKNYENKFVSSEKRNYNFEKYLKQENDDKEKEKQMQKEKYEKELYQLSFPILEILENYENEFVNLEKIRDDGKKKENEKEKQLQRENYAKKLHQFSILRKVLVPIIFDEEEDCKSFKKIFSDEEEKEFIKLYETALLVNHPVSNDDDEQTIKGGKILGTILL